MPSTGTSTWNPVFIASVALIATVVLFGVLFTERTAAAFDSVGSAIVSGVGWYYVLVVAGFVVFSLWIGLGRYGSILLGPDGEAPEFGRAAWFSMLFSAGMGIGLLFYGVAEPLSHFQNPPRGAEGGTVAAAQQAQHLSY